MDSSTAVEATPAEVSGLDSAALLGVVADPVRWRLLAALAAAAHCVCELQPVGGVAPNLLSYHLRVLREAGLVTATRRGRWIDYTLGRRCAGPAARRAARPGRHLLRLRLRDRSEADMTIPVRDIAELGAPTSGARYGAVALARRVAPLLLAATGWLAGYRLNGPLWDAVVYDAAGLDPSSRLGSGLHFFCYDTVKIALLLTGIIFVVTVLRSYITLERTRALLGGRRQGVGNVAAAGLGVVTPFCSCSAVPAFIGFVAAGVPIGVTLSFLIASPLVNEVAVVLLYGLFGFKIAALYVTSGLLIASPPGSSSAGCTSNAG